MSESSVAGRRFGSEFVDQHLRRFSRRLPEQRQLTYDIAVSDEYEPWRRWLDDQVALLPEPVADTLAGKLWLDEHFWPVIFELGAGAGLRAAGLDVSYERDVDGLTPDWTVLGSEGELAAFVEVHTDQPAAKTFGQMRAWHGLVERIKKIPVPVVLQLAAAGPVSPPDAGTAKRIARDLENKLIRNSFANMFLSNGYQFLVKGDPLRGGQQMASPLGMHACFIPPSSRAGAVSAQAMMEKVAGKARTYRRLAEDHGVPLIVAVGASRFTGVTLEDIDDILHGLDAPKVRFQFDAGDPYIGSQNVSWAPAPPWKWPQGLAGLLWISNRLPFTLTARANPASSLPMPPALLTLAGQRR